jgi:D-3-phosphoglycerate dehydrogenase / 2-oxoglutarate reductase
MSGETSVLLLGEVAPECAAALTAAGLRVDDGRAWSQGEALGLVARYDALVVGPGEPAPAALLRAGSRLRVVGRAGASVDGIDVGEATRRGIVVVHAPDADAVWRGERALALLLACAAGVVGGDAAVRGGGPGEAGTAVELHGKTLGLVGLDRGSDTLAGAAQGLRMTVLACCGGAPDELAAAGAAEIATAADVYAASDFIVVGDAAAGRARLGADDLRALKRGVHLVTPSAAVDAEALAAALADGHVAGAAVGVAAADAAAVPALKGVKGVVFFAESTSLDARARAAADVADAVAAALRGGFPAGAVNVPVAAGDDAAELMPYVDLCDQLGRLLVQLAGRPVDEVQITYGGSVAYFDTGLLTLAVLGGVLAGRVGGPVNFVNAQEHARELGVTVAESRQSDIPDYPRLITVSAGPGAEVSVSGTSLGPEHKPRLVRVFGEDVDIEPAPRMAFLRYVDAAGIGGKVGTLLGEWRVNIAHMSVGRGRLGDEAVMALTLDQPLTAAQAAELVLHCGLLYARAVEL